MTKTAIIIGSGFGGLGAAGLLGKAGYQVTVLEKNEMVGGRASVFEADGFRFDMGPSWYLMPDVFEHFFELLGEDVHQHLDLQKLGPSYRIFYKDTYRKVDIYSDLERDLPTVEQIEPGAGRALTRYLDQAAYQYDIAKDRFMYKNYDSIKDFFTKEMATEGRKLSVLSNMNRYVGKYFKTDAMQKIMQYPLVFLGSSPYNTPAIYNIMSHIDFNMGVYYPRGGIYEITKALQRIAEKHSAIFRVNTPVANIIVEGGKATGVRLEDGEELRADIVISNADIRHTEKDLLAKRYRTKTERYWKSRTLAPSAFIMYLGVKGELPSLTHHNLLFCKDWRKNFSEIFDKPLLSKLGADAFMSNKDKPKWPTDPSFYVSNPSKTDPTVAPEGHENLFVLVPVAPGINYDDKQLEAYGDKILQTMEQEFRLPDLRKSIVYKRFFSVKDFESRYNSYQGTALGLAHTLKQTAVFRPNNISKKVKNLYYVGAGTNPGIGMPVCLISAELMYKRLIGDKTAGPLKSEQLN